MPAVTSTRPSSSRTYTSRGKRSRRTESEPLLGTRAVIAMLGVMILALLISLGVIAAEAATGVPM